MVLREPVPYRLKTNNNGDCRQAASDQSAVRDCRGSRHGVIKIKLKLNIHCIARTLKHI